MRDAGFLAITVLMVSLLQVTSVGFLVPMDYKPDLMLVAVIWASLRVRLEAGMGFAFCSGLVMDFLSGAPTGLFALIYSVSFVACGFLNSTFVIDRAGGRMLAAWMATMIAGIAVMVMNWISGPIELGTANVLPLVAKSTTTGLACLLLFPVLDKMHNGFSRLIGAE